ncbi:MAG: hypothetical protein JWP08_2597 [Bryobacterales bacterium]|jgi:hypothetical protein|nr:hypothetical protein [Bryobacterales bacterium]
MLNLAGLVKAAAAACLMGIVSCAMASAQSRITCSSDNGGRQYCNADTRNGVVLVNQLSQSRCVQGRTWGFDRRGIWVDRGCRAEFALGRGGNRPGRGYDPGGREGRPGYGGNVQIITCASDNGKRQWCRNDNNGRVRLIKQRSDSPCREGYSWGTAPGSVWVDRGCRGDFEIRSRR